MLVTRGISWLEVVSESWGLKDGSCTKGRVGDVIEFVPPLGRDGSSGVGIMSLIVRDGSHLKI
jgi:hypothetical protein